MKNVLLVLYGFIITCTVAQSQNCNPEEVTTYPGKWKPGMQGSINGVSAASLAKQKEIVGNFVKRLQQNMKLEGFNIDYSGVYGYPNPALVKNRKMDAYELSMPVLPLYCENGQVKQAHETPYWVNIKINKIPYSGSQSFFVPKLIDEEDPDTDRLYYIDDKPIKERSAWLLSENFIGGFGKELTRYKWVIPYTDQLPFRYLTRKELCTRLIDYYQKKARYTKIEDEINYNKKLVASAQDYLDKTPAEELNRDAKVRGSMLSVFYQYEDNVPPFYDDADKNSTYVIDIDPNYFKGSLPLHTPQIITLEFIVDEKNKAVMNNMYKMLDALDIENLKTMMGNPTPFGKTNQPAKNTIPGTNTPGTVVEKKSASAKIQEKIISEPEAAALAQRANPCPTENLSDYPGAWKPYSGYQAVAQFKAKPGSYNKSAAIANLDKLLALAKQAYHQPMGGNANFTKYLDFSTAYSFMPIGYHLHIGHPGFVCGARNNIDLTYETGVTLKISINNPEVFASHITPYKVNGTDHYIGAMKNAESEYGINGKRVFLIHENFVSTNGWLDHYTEKIYRDEEPTQQWFIIRRENEPLFRYVTRKEYLTQFREEIKEYRDVYIHHIENQYKKYPESFKQTYEGLDDYKRRAENAIRLVDDYLKNKSREELSKPLSELINFEYILYSDATELKFREDRFHLAFFNEEYLDKKLPLHIPQFMVVFLSGSAHDKTGPDSWKYNFRKKMMDGLDFKAMYNMLAKIPVRVNQSQQPAAAKEIADKKSSPAVNPEKKSSPPELNKIEKPAIQQESPTTEDPLQPVYDLDGNKYTVIKIGNQYWLKENLRTTQYNDTTAIATGLTDSDWKQTKKGAYAVYENNMLNNNKYGKLYNGYAVATGKLCPKGWRVATDKDWKELEQFTGIPAAELDRTGERGNIADKLKTTEGWKTSAFAGTNSSGFSILPAGSRLDNGEFTTLGQFGNFWTSTVYDDRYDLLYLWNHHANYNSNAIGRIYTLANNGYSCRCILDNNTTTKNTN